MSIKKSVSPAPFSMVVLTKVNARSLRERVLVQVRNLLSIRQRSRARVALLPKLTIFVSTVSRFPPLRPVGDSYIIQPFVLGG